MAVPPLPLERTACDRYEATIASYCAVCANALAARRRRVSSLDAAVLAIHLGEHRAVIERIDHDGDAVMVLRRGAHHRRAADVDVLDRVLERAARLGDRRRERVQVDDDEVDRLDAVLAHHCVVGAAAAEQAAVDLRVQCLDPAVHDLREAGHRGHVECLDAFAAQQPAPCRRSK